MFGKQRLSVLVNPDFTVKIANMVRFAKIYLNAVEMVYALFINIKTVRMERNVFVTRVISGLIAQIILAQS
jgi:hypothetical protein